MCIVKLTLGEHLLVVQDELCFRKIKNKLNNYFSRKNMFKLNKLKLGSRSFFKCKLY